MNETKNSTAIKAKLNRMTIKIGSLGNAFLLPTLLEANYSHYCDYYYTSAPPAILRSLLQHFLNTNRERFPSERQRIR